MRGIAARWAPLHLKSHYSLGLGTASVAELVDRLRADGVEAAALTDVDNLYGQVRFHGLCRAIGVRPLTGVELTGMRRSAEGRRAVMRPEVTPRRRAARPAPRCRVVLLARDRTGYESLCRIVTWRRGGSVHRPSEGNGKDARPVPDLLETAGTEGLVALTDDTELADVLLERGILPRDSLRLLLVRPGPRRREARVRSASARLRIPLVADPDPLFLRPSDHRLHVLLRAVSAGVHVEDARGHDGFSARRHLPHPSRVARRYADVPEAVEETVRVADECRFDLLEGGPWVPCPPGLAPAAAHARLVDLTGELLASASAEGRCRDERYGQRLGEELAAIEARGLAGCFLVVGEIVEGARALGIPVAGRGSAVGSLVAHLMGLSPVDPVEAGLYFERFVHRRRRDLPDIDVDVSSPRREELIEWTRRRFGAERVAMASAIHRFQRRSAWADGLQALGLPPDRVDELRGRLPPDEIATEVEQGPPEGVSRRLVRLVERLIGKPRHVAVHPGGVVISPDELTRLAPVQASTGGVRVTQYDADALDALGIVKIDLLGSRGLAEMETAISLLPRTGELDRIGPRLGAAGPSAIPLHGREAFELLDSGDVLGIGQVETPAVRAVLEQVPVRTMDDLIGVLAVVRPGASAGRAKERWVRGARGERSAARTHPLLGEVLADTHGVLLFEEDIMRLLSRAAGMDLEEADELRREILDRQDDEAALAALGARFRKLAAANGMPWGEARPVWDEVLRFASYSFNKAHASSHALLAYQSAFLRSAAPVAFACGVLRHHGGSYPLRTLAGAIGRWGVQILTPDVGRSALFPEPEATSRGDAPRAVRLGLSQLRRLSERTARRVLRARADGRFRGLRDFLARARPSRIEIEPLVLTGACDGLHPLAAELFPFVHEEVVEAIRSGRALPEPGPFAAEIQAELAEDGGDALARYRRLVRVRYELRFLEMHPTHHPMEILRDDARREGCVTTTEASLRVGTSVRLATLLAAGRRAVRNGKLMRFLTLEDEEGLLESVVLPPRHEVLGARLTTPGPYLVEGRVREEHDHPYLEIRDVRPFHTRHRAPTSVRTYRGRR